MFKVFRVIANKSSVLGRSNAGSEMPTSRQALVLSI